jgi:hypothetical protein
MTLKLILALSALLPKTPVEVGLIETVAVLRTEVKVRLLG